MSLKNNMADVFSKLDDLKTVFKFGEKVVPIIQNLIEFMKEIVPLLEQINTSIADSTKQMPKATYQINDVTSATELATNEILDLVDQISNTLERLEASVDGLIEQSKSRDELRIKLLNVLAGNDEAISIFNEYEKLQITSGEIDEYKQIIKSVSEDTYKITLSLQVQDITTQQLGAVNHLIVSVNNRLSSLIENIEKSDLHSDIEELSIELPKDVHFDANATYNNREGKQDAVDELIEVENKKTTQAEIDELFK
ncbi:MAG: protein phosphatase CheZ [Melioribacteraceae bacterium]|nr:protein phosphatase CheZ [Melioribacteraceae bacterium]MCF8353743.1 protein phosphatase CheZ [Melioribacteraceae bacterium]MCF8392448.1 protein phosphatase CheZ [Melioribacteraceae bacterium]MCF8418359.1 protein phosphatase CheZ [Melioribacteraceae bacterium]